jgi:hypothetical protein
MLTTVELGCHGCQPCIIAVILQAHKKHLFGFLYIFNDKQNHYISLNYNNLMKGVVKKEILSDLQKVIAILEEDGLQASEKLKLHSNHAIEHVALYKNLDSVSLTVLIYSLYKIYDQLKTENRNEIIEELLKAKLALKTNFFGKYNSHIKKLYKLIKHQNVKVKEHLQDVMQAARIKKGTVLLEKGLSLGQAAGLMGLSNWDLQKYAARTPALTVHKETIHAYKRLEIAYDIFGVKFVGTKQ